MSANAKAAFEAFLAACNERDELKHKLKTLPDEQIVKEANALGFVFTLEDLRTILGGELDDQELAKGDLELVAGGAIGLNAVSDGWVCNTIRSLSTGESGCSSLKVRAAKAI